MQYLWLSARVRWRDRRDRVDQASPEGYSEFRTTEPLRRLWAGRQPEAGISCLRISMPTENRHDVNPFMPPLSDTTEQPPAPVDRRWQRIRAKGRSRFIWVWGVLGYGLTTAVVSSVVRIVHRDSNFVTEFGCALVPSLVCGYFFGLVMWKSNERQYHRAIRNRGHH
jgi:hypothetical protein